MTSAFEALPVAILSRIAKHLVIRSETDYHPSPLLSLLTTNKLIHGKLSSEANPQLYHDLFRGTFDTQALARRYPWLVENSQNIPYLEFADKEVLFDPRGQGIEYKRLWETCGRARATISAGTAVIPGVTTINHIIPDLWQFWFLATENDGRNEHFLREHCKIRKYMEVVYAREFVSQVLQPGYVKDTVLRALAIWIAVFAGTDHDAEEHAAAVDEKIFVLRPFVFANHQYDVSYAPWNFRTLPISEAQAREAAASAPSSPFAASLTTTSKGVDVERFGSTWHLVPPYLTLGAYVIFMRMLERQPAFMGANQLENITSFRPLDPEAEPSPFGLFHSPQWHPESISSYHHDLEHQRMFVCLDSSKSKGLQPLAIRGRLQGFWRGRYLFMDFDAYLAMVGGDMRKVYDAPFGQQIAEMELQEVVVNVRTEDLGGKGPIRNAGFLEEGEEDHYHLCEDETAPDEPGWSKEMLLFGVGRSTWGWHLMKGRVRSWDGLVTMAMQYDPAIASIVKWNWRGYIQSGGMFVGRWRDGITQDHMRGYEGPWAMLRAGDSLYPANYPTSIAQSNGLARTFVDSDCPPPPVYDVFGRQLKFMECARPPLPVSVGSDEIPLSLRNLQTRLMNSSEEPSSASVTPTPASSASLHLATPAALRELKSAPPSTSVESPSAKPRQTTNDGGASAPPSIQALSSLFDGSEVVPSRPVTPEPSKTAPTPSPVPLQHETCPAPAASNDTAKLDSAQAPAPVPPLHQQVQLMTPRPNEAPRAVAEALSKDPVAEALPGGPPVPEAAVDNVPGITGKRKRDPEESQSAAMA